MACNCFCPQQGKETIFGLERNGYLLVKSQRKATSKYALPKKDARCTSQQGHIANMPCAGGHPCLPMVSPKNPQREVQRPGDMFPRTIHHHAIFLVQTMPPLLPPSDAVNKRGHTTALSSPLLLSALSTRQLAHKSRTPSSASGCTTIAKTASTPPAPGTPAQRTPGRADVASTSLVWTGGSIETPASCTKTKSGRATAVVSVSHKLRMLTRPQTQSFGVVQGAHIERNGILTQPIVRRLNTRKYHCCIAKASNSLTSPTSRKS